MAGELLIAAGPGEWRAAWVEGGAPAELFVERGDVLRAGSIHLGRVVRRLPGLDAALVDIAADKPGFLHWRDADGAGLDDGSRVIVQIRREAQQDKGARLSLQLRPHASAQTTADVTLRTAGLEAPAQLSPPPGFAWALALGLPSLPESVLCDEPGIVAELRAAFPGTPVAQRPVADWPIDLDAVFASALAARIALPGNGSLHFAETRAAVLIDVDTGLADAASGERSARAVNRAAARAIAQQLRLRQLGGGIVIDFVGLEGRASRDGLRQCLIAALAGDPAKPEVLGWTRLGHLEMVRPRTRRPLSEDMLEPGGGKSSIALAFEALRSVQREARAQPAAAWRITAAREVAAALQGPAASGLRALEARLARPVEIVAKPDRETADFDIAPV